MKWLVYLVMTLAFGACGGFSTSSHGVGFVVGCFIGFGAAQMTRRFFDSASNL